MIEAHWEVIGPGLVAGDAKVRCTGCGREGMRRMHFELALRGCRACAYRKSAKRRAGIGGRAYASSIGRREEQSE